MRCYFFLAVAHPSKKSLALARTNSNRTRPFTIATPFCSIDETPPTPEGSNGGPFVVLWALVGTVEDFDGAGIAKIKVDRDQSSGFILDTAYLNANAPIEGGSVIAIGDKIECRFLYDSNSEIIDPEKSGYIRIVDSGPAS